MINAQTKGKRSSQGIILLLLCILACGLMVFLVCNISGILELITPPPGVGPKADLGYQVCQPVIDALAEYYKTEGTYPVLLKSLTPIYLADVPSRVNDFPIIYQATQGSYSLEFRYTGPGMNICTYRPENKWHCGGFY